MPRVTDKERVATRQKRIDSALKVRKEWEKKYRCEDNENYYYGHQAPKGDTSDRYTVNEVFSSIEIQMPSELFYHPRVIVKARTNKTDDPGSNAEARAQLQEDTLNTFISDRRLGFKEEIQLAQLESKFRYGVVEVGYSADWLDNPNFGKPTLKENGEEMMDSENNPVPQPAQTLQSENIYFKYIPADEFLVGVGSRNRLNRCDWIAYCEWHYVEDLKRNRRYKNTSNLKGSGKIKTDNQPTMPDDDTSNMVRVWKQWDLREKKRYDWAESNEKFLLDGEPMDVRKDGSPVIPFAVLKRHERLKEFYPLPPVFNWLGPQDWLNEQRNIYRKMLKKLLPKFGYRGDMADEEIAKFLENDITLTNIPGGPESLWAINMPSTDNGALRNSPVTKEDFREVSGVSGEQRGIADADTATQANIINFESRIRETKGRSQVADWLSNICELALWYLSNRMVGAMWVKTNIDPLSQNAPVEAMSVEKTWREIKSSDISGIDSDVIVDVESLSPVSEQGERQDWLNALAIVSDPVKGPMILSNEILLRKTLGYFGIKNEKDIQALKQFGTMTLQMLMAAQQQQAGAPGASGAAAPGPTPNNQDIQSQLAAQMGTPWVA